MSVYLWAGLIGWAAAQGAKYFVAAVKARSFRVFDRLYLSGNMPSAHSATVMSMVTIIGLRDGISGATFGVAVTLAAIVMYDAMMVRRSVGEQGEAIKSLIKATGKREVTVPRAAKGHSPAEVLVCVLVGVLAGFVVFYATT